jgi:hypothetical protein
VVCAYSWNPVTVCAQQNLPSVCQWLAALRN